MKLSKVKQWFIDSELNFNTISFFCDATGEEMDDVEFGTCDISGADCDVVNCICADLNGNIIEFQASEHLVSGALGELAGAF